MVMSLVAPLAAAVLALLQAAPHQTAAQAAAPVPAHSASSACTIGGTLTAGKTPLPGVVLTLTSRAAPDAPPLDVTASNPDGSYTLKVPGPGQYTLKGQLIAFAPLVQDITVDAANCSPQVDLQMTLASRAPTPAPAATAAASASPNPNAPAANGAANANAPAASGANAAGAANAANRAGGNNANGQRARTRGAGRSQQGPRQFQSLSLVADQAGLAQQNANDGASETLAQALLPPGFSPETSSESVTTFGTQSRGSESLFGPGGPGQRFGPGGLPEGLDAAGAAAMLGFGPPGVAFAGAGRGGFGGGNVGFGPGGGGFGGPGGFGGGFGGPGGFGRARNQIRGSFFQSFDTSNFDAGPYALNGQSTTKPDYLQQRFGATLGGPLTIPKLLPADTRTFFFLNYTGNHSRNPYDQYSTVPTAAERAGDLSSFGHAIVDPLTGQPFAGNQIPASRLDAASQSLLDLFPLPNQSGDVKNFHHVTTTTTQMDDINFRFIRNFGKTTQRRPGQNGRARGGAGRGFGGRGGPGRGGQNLNIAVNYRHANGTSVNPFPTLGGDTKTSAWNVSGGYSTSVYGIVNQFRVQFNRQNSRGQNLYAFSQDIAADAGLAGVSADPFDWGAPNLSFSQFSSLRDMNPSQRTDRTVAISDTMLKQKGKHTLRWGGDYRDIRFDSRTDANARGSYVFTGLFTGSDFADYLLGLPQQSTVQYGPGTERFRSNSWDLFFQDDWRIAPKLTINAGVRYEYFSPVSEADNRLVTLAAPADFTAAVPVVAGGTNPFGGTLPDTIVHPFRTGFAPRIGVAWRAPKSFIVRTGYGINYNSRTYQTIATQLAGQPPFATTGTVLATAASPVLLQTALAGISPDATNNTYGIDPDYRLGFVQIWNVDIQHDLTRTLNLGIGYVGTKGANLDVLRAPNRGPAGLRIDGVPPFIWESSGAESIMHMFTVRLRKRLTKGLALGGRYTLSKSIDDASSIGGSGGVVAQNDLDLAAERGLSSFDQRHRFSADFTYELPFGENRHWLNDGGSLAALLGNWMFNGSAQLASGTPFTARVLASVQDVARGTNGTLRANYDGAPIALGDPTTRLFFNTSAFSLPATGTFGDAGRNTIVGPGTSVMNLGLTRNISLGQTRGLSVTVFANNVLNSVQYAAIDAVVNSPTFGQVLSVRPMRTILVTTRFRF